MHTTKQPIEGDVVTQSSPPSTPPSAKPTDFSERVLAHLVQGHATLPQLAATLGMTLRELASWVMESQNWQTLAALSRLGDLQTHMIVGRFRITAAIHLLGMAGGKDSTELARRACADLLEARLDSPASADASVRRPGALRPPSGGGWPAGIVPNISAPVEKDILNALEELGRDFDEQPEPQPPNVT